VTLVVVAKRQFLTVFQPVLPLHECANPTAAESTIVESAAKPLHSVTDSAAAKSTAEPLQSVTDSVADSTAASAALTENLDYIT
jgi:hypothetical protein